MELEPKYIRAYNEKYEVDSVFIEKLHMYPVEISLNIIDQVKSVVDHLPKKEEYMQLVSGVVKGDKPFFFQVMYLNEPEYMPIFTDIEEIDVDEYLDEINNKKTITWSRQDTK